MNMATTTEVIRDTGTLPVTYDRYGRMNYHPDFHPNQRHPWTTTDQKYLIANYEKDGPEAVSFALGRTVHTVMTRACQLRKRGDMPKPAARIKHRRIKPR